jgi:GNAT superfamily N-acetyltransferase
LKIALLNFSETLVLALFTAIPLGFYLNGILMQKFTSNSLYSAGLLLGGLVVSLLTFLSGPTWEVIVLFGFIDGIAGGIYWANRNLLTLRTTQSDNRIYFSEYRKKGLGKKLMGEVEKKAKSLHCYRLFIESHYDHKQTHKFYEALGYTNYGYHFIKNLN